MQQVGAGPSLPHHLQPSDTPLWARGPFVTCRLTCCGNARCAIGREVLNDVLVQVGAPFHPLREGVPEWLRALGCGSVRADVAVAGSSTAAVESQSACFPRAPPDEKWPASPLEWNELI